MTTINNGDSNINSDVSDTFSESEIDESHSLPIRRSLWQSVSVEPVMFLYMMAFMLTSVIEESLFVDKACRINLGFSASICDHINAANNTFYKKKVQIVVSNFRQYESIALHAVPMVLALLLGVWSDKHGRKLPMLLGLLGALFYAVMIVVNVLQDWPLEMVLYTATFPSAMTGSALAIFLAAFTYVADVSSVEQRTQRVTFLEVAYLITMPTGVALGSYIFSNVVNKSYASMFCIHAGLVLFAILYACLTMEKKSNVMTVQNVNVFEEGSNEYSSPNGADGWCFFDLWNWRVIIDSFKVVFKKRPQKRRIYLILVLLAMGFYTFQRDEKHIVYLYTQLEFHWSVIDYSHFRTLQSAYLVIGLLTGVPMMTKVFSLPDTVIVMVGSLSHATARVIFATAKQPSLFFIGAAISAYGPIVAPVLRSITSKLVPPSERGKAFSMLTVADISVPLVSGVVYTQVYNATINMAPSSFFWITVTSQLFVLAIIVYIHVSLNGRVVEQAKETKQIQAPHTCKRITLRS